MIQEPVFLLNGFLILGAMWFASYAKAGRKEAVLCSIALAANFLLCALSFTDTSMKSALSVIGFSMTHKETWMLADTLLGAFCVTVAYRRLWAYALCAMCMGQIGVHAALMEHVIDGDAYSEILDIVLHAQVAVFYLLGGRGVGQLLRSSIAGFRRPRRIAQTARAFSEAEE